MIDLLLSPDPKAFGEDINVLLDSLTGAPAALPFDEPLIAFVATLSRRVLTDGKFREHPELMAMAHWFRAANLRDLKSQLPSGESIFVRRGVVFHIAPSNVDSVFIYSWLLSLLCGNANIARVSRRRSNQMQAFFAMVKALLGQDEFCALTQSNLVLSYEHDSKLTQTFTDCCHLRVVWGGDQTLRDIRSIPLPPLSSELAFANRFSLAVLNAGEVLDLDAERLEALAAGFYNDAFWFNQQACSSPRAVVWIGKAGCGSKARERFWDAVRAQVSKQKPENLPSQVMDRATTLFRLAYRHGAAETAVGALPSRILVPELGPEDRTCHDGNGLFIELDRDNLTDVLPLLASRDQTISYFGYSRSDWLSILPSLPPHAADRIVPVGQALAFSTVWDGVNLLRAFTREVDIRQS